MSVNSGIQFPTPRLPESHSLREVTSSGGIANAISHRQIPSYPPLRLEQILRLIENGSSDAITVLEWMNVFRLELFFESDEDGYRAASLIWQAISENERLSRIALYLAGLQINGQNDKFPELLIDSMDVAKPLLTGIHLERVSWLIALKSMDYVSCVHMALKLKCVPTDVPRSLNLPLVTKYRRELQSAIITLVTSNLENRTKTWLEEAFSKTTRLEMIELVDSLLGKKEAVFSQFLPWLKKVCHPESVDTIWFEISEKSRQKLKSDFQLGSFFVLQSFIDILIENSTEKLEDHEKKKLRSRVSFWSNYSEKIGQIKFILPKSWNLESVVNQVTGLEYLVSRDDEMDGDNPACIFELEKVIAVIVLTGRASEIRLFENNKRNRNRFFNSQKMTLTQIRKAASLHIHDHVTLWQYFFEQILRKQLDILPNEGISYFNGMRKEYGKYEVAQGLRVPSAEYISERETYLSSWLNAFWDREKALNVTEESVAFIKLQFAKLAKVKGDKKKYRMLLREACDEGSSEAMYLLAFDILTASNSAIDEKIKAEGMLKESASHGYLPAKKLCKQFYLTYQKKTSSSSNPDKVSTPDEVVPKLSKTVLQSASLERIKNKLSKNNTRPYVSLKIDELEVLAEDKALSYLEKLGIANELEQRKQTQRVKNLIEFLDVS